MKIRFGIHFRLLAAGFAIIVATTVILGYMGLRISRQFVQIRFEDRIDFLTRHLALNAELGVLIDDRDMLKRLAMNLLSEKDVVAVSIFDREGNELTGVVRKMAGSVLFREYPVTLRAVEEETRAFAEEIPGGSKTEQTIGGVRIAYSTKGIDQLLVTMRNRFALLSIGLAAVVGFVFYFLSHSLVAPVTELAGAAKRVAGGDMKFRVEPGTLPETRDLALAFNAMLDSLEQSRGALEKVHQEMMRRNTLAEMGKFSLMIAHEVKNPLSIIKTSLDLLKKDRADIAGETLVVYIEEEIRRMNRLIEDFLAFARPSRPVFREVRINELVRTILTRFEMQHAGLPLQVSLECLDEERVIDGDPDLLTRAVDNILKNAFEANGEKGRIAVALHRNGERISIEVRDEGEGISEEIMDRICEPFFTTRSKGTGLGLAYVLQVIESHGGFLKAENHPEGGALFRIELSAGRSCPST